MWELFQYQNDCAVASVIMSLKCVRFFVNRHIDYVSALKYNVNVTLFNADMTIFSSFDPILYSTVYISPTATLFKINGKCFQLVALIFVA